MQEQHGEEEVSPISPLLTPVTVNFTWISSHACPDLPTKSETDHMISFLLKYSCHTAIIPVFSFHFVLMLHLMHLLVADLDPDPGLNLTV